MPEVVTNEEKRLTERYLQDPVLFMQVALGARLWGKQKEIARAIRDHDRVAVKACNASGKSWLIGRLIPWWITRYSNENPKVLITAAGWQQVQNIASVEYRSAAAESLVPLPELNAKAEAKDDKGRPIVIGIAPRNAVRMQGHHAGHILIIVDEASNPDIPWDAIEGNLAGGHAHLLLLGNPTIPSGYYYDAFHGKAAGSYHQMTIDAFETPNLEGFSLDVIKSLPSDLKESDPIFKFEPFRGLTTRWWVYQKYHQWGESSPAWESRVRGEFPSQADDAVFPMAWLRDAQKCEPLPIGTSRVRLGIDVAGPGDDEMVVYRTRGGNIIDFKAWAYSDPREGRAQAEVLAFLSTDKPDDVECVAVDTNGPGMYFPERIETAHYPVQRVNFGTAAQRADLYHLRKEEMYWHVRGLFKDGLVAGLTDEETIQQLAGVRYLEDDKRRMRRSTDYGARRYRAVNARVLPRPRQGRRGQTTRSERGDSSNPY
jgi:phage terminase large subunit